MVNTQSKKFTLVEISPKGEPVASTEVIAKGVSIQHKNILALVKKHKGLLERFGRVAFETRPFKTAGGEQVREVSMLNEPQAALLLTLTRNTEATMDFKANLVHEFFAMRDALRNRDLNLWEQMQRLITKEVKSEVFASFGSHLMLKRKKDIPKLKKERKSLEAKIQPSLLPH